MALTQKQISNLNRLPLDDLIEILHICADAAGLVSVSNYAKYHGMKDRREAYRLIESGKLKPIDIGGTRLVSMRM